MKMKDSKNPDDQRVIASTLERIADLEAEKNPKNDSFIAELKRRVRSWKAL
jgi:hypothetical protein